MKNIITIIALFFTVVGFSQTPEMVKEQGDQYFENEQYYKAIEFYKAALEREEGLLGAKFQLAECYRLTFDPESAEFYYGEVANSRSQTFHLAGFYYGLMKKFNGKFLDASSELEKFIQRIKTNELTEDEKFRRFYLQAKVEMAGCQLALNELTKPKVNREFIELGAPINTEFNDYGAHIFLNDSSLVFSSGRKSGRGQLIDYKFGESFSDLFRFRLTSNGWRQISENDRFETLFNTKWGEGAGVYNSDMTKFYFTHCNDEQGTCFIYKSDKANGKWNEPFPLNENINQTGFNSKHPSLTVTGDTLFFTSEREGTKGGYDIWYSISSGTDNWSTPINMGDHVNTSFDEIAPFYYQKDKALFFASTGHRGFGGFDVFLAKGEAFDRPEIFNVGAPYNSSKDDCFMVLGNDFGYLSSNREGGMGKFDIYQFINKKDEEEIIAEIEVDDAIAGRNSLFANDYEFDSPDQIKINQIVSQFLANKLVNADLVLDNVSLEFFSNLSTDDKDRIARIVNARYRKMTQGELRSLRVEDEFFYQQLQKEEREQVDQIVYRRIEHRDLAVSVSYDSDSELFYSQLDDSEREKVDQIIAYRVNDAKRNEFVPDVYPSYSSTDRTQIDVITDSYFELKKGINQLPLRPTQRVFIKGEENEEKLNEAIKERVIMLTNEQRYALTSDDRTFFQNLSTEQISSLEELASAFVIADVTALDEYITTSERTFYRLLNSTQRKSADRILAKLINNLTVSDIYFADVNFNDSEIAQLNEVKDQSSEIDKILSDLSQDNRPEILTTENKIRLDRFLEISGDDWVQGELPGFLPKEDVEKIISTSPMVAANVTPADIDKASTDAFNTDKSSNQGSAPPSISDPSPAKESTSSDKPAGEPVAIVTESEPKTLTEEDVKFYTERSPEDQLKIDRYIGAKYLTDAYRSVSLVSSDLDYYKNLSPKEKKHINILARRTKGENIPYDAIIEAFNFYNNSSIQTKKIWNRLVYSRALTKASSSYKALPTDYRFVNSLSEEEKASIQQIALHRSGNERLISENFLAESLDVPRKAILDNLISYNTSNYRYIDIAGQLTDEKTGQPLANFPLGLQQGEGGVEYQIYTDNQGRFNFENVPSKDYQVIALESSEEKFTESFFIRDIKVAGHVENVLSNEVGTSIYFNSGSTSIRPEGQVTLKEIADYYSRNKNSRIELHGHTDNVGQQELNIALSKSRAETTMQELIKLGISPQNLIINFHGLSKPVTTNLSRYGRQFNRRVEIKVQSSEAVTYQPPKIYLVRPKGTLYSISKHFDLEIDEILRLNGIEGSRINAYEPLRIPNPDNRKPLLEMLVELNTSLDAGLKTYTVKEGDTIASIAKKFNLPEEFIMEINNLDNNELTVGQVLKIYLSL